MKKQMMITVALGLSVLLNAATAQIVQKDTNNIKNLPDINCSRQKQ